MITSCKPEDADAALNDFLEAAAAKSLSDRLRVEALSTCVPCLPDRFLQWLFSQSDKFYADQSGLWNSLFTQEMHATPLQLQLVQNLRQQLTEGRGNKPGLSATTDATAATRAYEKLMSWSIEESSKALANFMQTFDSSQLVLFFQWVQRFGTVCIQINL